MACKKLHCMISTGIHGGLTFGDGELDNNGYWKNPCYSCARDWETKRPLDAPCWPFKEQHISVVGITSKEFEDAFEEIESGELL